MTKAWHHQQLGLASDRAASKIDPDYTSSVAELYKRVAIHHLQKYGLEFLELAGDTSLRRVNGLPSRLVKFHVVQHWKVRILGAILRESAYRR